MNEEYKIFLGQTVISRLQIKYIIKKFVCEGGNGYIFECEDCSKNKNFIIKFLYKNTKTKIANFRNEIALEKNIKSDYTISCIDDGEFLYRKKPTPFYVMRKYDGTLEDLINENLISPIKAFKYCIQLCKGLKALHYQTEKIIHRDLKPENILYDEKLDRVIICDLGLAHVGNEKNTINNGFAGNIDYHAPEQKKRGKQKIGTYTDIYSLGLIMNVLFTKEIPQGENYKKIWECAPYFSFVDNIIDRMIRHDISEREDDINSILLDLEKHNFKYEINRNILDSKYRKMHLSKDKMTRLLDLFSLLEFTIKNKIQWDRVNVNYYCDYHFSCNDVLRNTILLSCFYERIKEKFENEKFNPIFKTLNLNKKQDKQLFDDFCKKVELLPVLFSFDYLKEIIIKYFISLNDYHAREIFSSDFSHVEENVDLYCIDAPILCISNIISNHLSSFSDTHYVISDYVILDKYEESNVKDKTKFYKNIDESFLKLEAKLKELFNDIGITIVGKKMEISFGNKSQESIFEDFIRMIAGTYDKNDVRRYDILDLIKCAEKTNLMKVYKLDSCDINRILDKTDYIKGKFKMMIAAK